VEKYMMKTTNNHVQKVRDAVKTLMLGEASGHDWTHVQRVSALALTLAEDSHGADPILVELGAVLHDVGDHKFHNGDHSVGPRMARQIMLSAGITDIMLMKDVEDIVSNVSWSKGGAPATMEGKLVQDADRLDAIGNIGIARCFAYGGATGGVLQDSMQHFEDKLFKVKDRMNTDAGRKVAMVRHRRMVAFVQNFQDEEAGIS